MNREELKAGYKALFGEPIGWKNKMTEFEQAAEMFGKVCYLHDDYEVRAITKDDGLHIFVFRVVDGKAQMPHGFIGGHNHLFFPKREVR